MAAGVSTCHEALSADDIMDRARVGVHAMLRESSAARTLVQQLECIVGKGIDTSMMLHRHRRPPYVRLGGDRHLDHHLKLARAQGFLR